jgi:HEAT repeat-containing protein 5
MVKMAVLAGWAELQVASVEQKYLESAVKPQVRILAPLWLNSLRDFAQLRFEPDVASTVGPTPSLGGSMDSIYSSLNRDTLLKVGGEFRSFGLLD